MAKVFSLPHRSSLPWTAQSILELAPGPIAVWNADRSNCILNDAARKLTGFTERDFRETRTLWIGRIHPEDQKPFSAFWNELERTENKLTCDYRFLQKTRKQEIRLRDNSTSLRSADGLIDTIISAYTDISDLRVHHAEGPATGRTDQPLDLIRPFLHEVQNSLHVIRMGVDLMSMDPTTSVGLQSVTRGIESLDKLSHELYEYCFPKPAVPVSKQLRTPFKEVIDRVQSELQHRGITVRIADRSAAGLLQIDLLDFLRALKHVTKLCQALLPPCGELEVEAIREITAGRVALVLKIESAVPSGDFDDQQVFHPFFRIHGNHIGLGMAIAQQILRLMGGDILFRKESGQRVVVTVLLKT